MHKLLAVLFLFLMPIAFTSCGADTHESLAKDADAQIGKLVEILEGITDAESAKASKDKFIATVERIKDIKKKSDGLEKPDAEVQKKLEEQFMGPESNMMKMMAEMGRIAQIEGTQDTLQELGKAMSTLE